MESTDSDEYQAAIAPLREHLDTTYRPLVEAYTSALVAGDDSRAAHLAEDLDAAADELETRWTATLFTKAADLPNGVFVNEAAGAMAMSRTSGLLSRRRTGSAFEMRVRSSFVTSASRHESARRLAFRCCTASLAGSSGRREVLHKARSL